MHWIEELRSYTFFGWTIIATIVASLVFLIEGYKRIRDQGWCKWAAPFDNTVTKINDKLLLRPHYPVSRYPSSTPDNERDFYEEFSKALKVGTSRIYNSGDGFNMLDRRADFFGSGDKADILDSALIYALDHSNVEYRRFQITSACGLGWISRLIYMKERYGDRFKIFTNKDYDHLGCFCAIDPESPRCMFEWQILSYRHWLEGNITKGYGFTYMNQNICRKVAAIFWEIERSCWHLQNHEIYGDMTVEKLRKYQKTLWDERVLVLQTDPNKEPADVEIVNAVKKRKINVRNFDISQMDFREEEFPIFPCPPSVMPTPPIECIERRKEDEGEPTAAKAA
jgi:hypothetical protein